MVGRNEAAGILQSHRSSVCYERLFNMEDFMRTIILFSLLAILSIPAKAEISDSYQFQAKTQQITATQSFWGNFWNILRGKETPRSADLTVKVINSTDGSPLQGATVLVGNKAGEPFAKNEMITDANGMAFFSDPELKSGKAFTITAYTNEFGSFSLMDNKTNSVEISLQPITRGPSHSFLQGKLLGFPPGYGQGELEIGMFIPGFRGESLLDFDPQLIISSYKVEIDVFGKRQVPGNVVMPRQRKRYGIIPFSIEKPEFIMPLSNGFTAHMSGIVGALPIGGAVDAIKEKDFLGVLNLTNLTHIGYTERMTVRGNERFDVQANTQLESKAVKAQLTGVAPKLDAISVSLFDPANDRQDYIPMDVKALKWEQITNGNGLIKLSTLKERRDLDSYYVFTGLFDRTQLGESRSNVNSRFLVGALQQVNNSNLSAPFNGFLKIIQSSGVGMGNREFRFTTAANPNASLSPEMVLLNIVSQKRNLETQGVTRTVLWSAVANGNFEKFSLPDLGRPVLPNPDVANGEVFFWEIIALTTDTKQSEQARSLDLQTSLRNLHHVSSLVTKF